MSTTSPATSWPPRIRPRRPTAVDVARLRTGLPVAGLLALTAILYLWGLSRSSYANQYYAAAVQAGTHSWKAFLFGSLDAANYITVDKPPASLWLMELSARLFGFSSFSLLLPQTLEGVAAVGVLYATVRRWFGRPAALLSGLILALTPVAAVMFRYDQPDALLVLLLVAAAYALTRALEGGASRWMVVAGTALGFAFLSKMMQAFLVLPAFALVYFVAAPLGVRRRLWQLLRGALALLISAGWWVALVELWPASARPYIGGSTNNSILQLIFGWNGLDRISSGQGGGVSFSGSAGIARLFNAELGGQISWLLPAALIVLLLGLFWTARRGRADRTRAALLLWGGWLLTSAAVYSFMTGVIHPYYSNTLAPPIAVLVGVSLTILWRRRAALTARLALALMIAVTGGWSYALLDRTPSWHPWLRIAILAVAAISALTILALGPRLKRLGLLAAAIGGMFVLLAGPTAYTLSTLSGTQSGSSASAGPAVAAEGGFAGGMSPGRLTGGTQQSAGALPGRASGISGGPTQSSITRALASRLEQHASRYTWVAATSSSQTAASVELATGESVMAIGGFSGSDPATTLSHFKQLVSKKTIHYYVAGGGIGGPPGGGLSSAFARGMAPGYGEGPSGGRGGLRPGVTGGNGIGGLGMGTSRGQATNTAIQSWVKTHFKSTTVGGITIYDLTQAKSN